MVELSSWADMYRSFPTITARVSVETRKRLEKRSAQFGKSKGALARDFIEHGLALLDSDESDA
jgi:predicted DNA-binding protein